MGQNIDPSRSLEKILEKTVEVLAESKKEIFTIAESIRREYDNIKRELDLINEEINEVVAKVDKLQEVNRIARIRLMEVSRDFEKHSEYDIKYAYQQAEDTSVQIAVLREKEEQLKKRRAELENRLINLKRNIEKAENMVSRVGVVHDYLLGELSNLSEQFDDLRQKQQLAIKIIQAQEDERKRVAREIHDGPAQSIANLVFRVELAQKLMDKDLKKARNELEDVKELVRLSMQEVRKIIYDLRPMSLDDLGLIPTLRRYINKFNEQTKIIIDFNILGPKRRLPNTYEITIFRLIQEGLNNIYKHSKASTGTVTLEYTPEQINILISDDGIGFKPEEVGANKFGLVSMRERCELLGGKLDLFSEKNKGTKIKITLPIKQRGGKDEADKGISS
ncbi:sensor histidine kinase [Halothermothrix orenii]|uniref:Oxygen sensor histidine kinase NreB n=1 Tax=Halothermothrix orenii (strain H 168 / OCM 544 / DSM 9562) TaxID=373903 RepID=B8D0J3_HALOH|nr:sensor histidine kinase [Halothermothrix orenii]ACL70929.1 histidine kinase [Halothermothrix orenii H 168]